MAFALGKLIKFEKETIVRIMTTTTPRKPMKRRKKETTVDHLPLTTTSRLPTY